MAQYMALRGLAIFGTPLLILVYTLVPEERWSVAVMVSICVVAAGVPFIRSVTGKVWVDGGTLCARNGFRTVRVPMNEVGCVTVRPLWQNFFTVAAIEQKIPTRRRPLALVPVPAEDADVLAAKLGIRLSPHIVHA